MANDQALTERISKMKDDLEEIEKDLHNAAVSGALLDDLKGAVDHIRTTLFAIMSNAASENVNNAIVTLRLKRAIQIAQQIRNDIEASEITVEMPEVRKLRDSFDQAVSRIDRLLTSGF